MNEENRCPVCNGALVRGRLVLAFEGSVFPVTWVRDGADLSRSDEKFSHPVEVYRCVECGLLNGYRA